MYRRSNRYSRQLANMRAAKERKRLEGDAPDYPPDLPEIRREVLVIDYDTGTAVAHHYVLRRSRRVNSYRVEENGREWCGRWGWARFLAVVRQRFPACGRFD